MESRAAQLRDMAWECRTLAKTVQQRVREQLFEVAKQFEALAEQYEKNNRPTRPHIRC